MKSKKRIKIIKKSGIILVLLLITLSLVPYLIPLPKHAVIVDNPFENSHFIQLEGIQIHYRTWGNEDSREKALLVHGLAGSTFSWRKNVDTLVKEGFHVIAVDLPGFGYSDRKRGFNHSQQNRATILNGLMGYLEKGKDDVRWLAMGHSMGGGTVAALTISYPERIAALVIVAGAVYNRPTRFSQRFVNIPPISRWFQVIGRYFLLKESRISNLLRSAYGREPKLEEILGYLEPLLVPGTEGSFIDLILSTRSIDEGKLKEIKIPTLIIWGENDAWVTLEQGYRLKEEIKNSILKIIPNSAHCPMETHYKEFNEILINFISK